MRHFVRSGLAAGLPRVARLDLNGGPPGDKVSEGVADAATAEAPVGVGVQPTAGVADGRQDAVSASDAVGDSLTMTATVSATAIRDCGK